jgi:hypothetical protein
MCSEELLWRQWESGKGNGCATNRLHSPIPSDRFRVGKILHRSPQHKSGQFCEKITSFLLLELDLPGAVLLRKWRRTTVVHISMYSCAKNSPKSWFLDPQKYEIESIILYFDTEDQWQAAYNKSKVGSIIQTVSHNQFRAAKKRRQL